ncbi:hypothetical protein N7539_000177 [Penicillium diatomitis]|uniref:Integral membrane protein n=1 Tax=Penicillium diatomitis TaxID=2819901 RepID=A0A9W9XL94_9EURO|nr:uncharacterized protein N7539_000177 [Penicillium diatomitis]KAJ5495061.1 hypothetical protein N7539_000177 [Penicillium diatomitis]
MDPIEPAERATVQPHVSDQLQPTEATAPHQQPQRPRALSNRSRRPSIRLNRLPSIPSIDLSLFDHPPGAPLARQVSIQSPVQEEDESGTAGRRRSSSEPRPATWNFPSQNGATRGSTRMGFITEEPVHYDSRSGVNRPPQVADQGPDELQQPPQVIHRVPSRNPLRRASMATLNRFGWNRASTVGEAPSLLGPGAQQQQQQQQQQKPPPAQAQGSGEYGSHVVDVLDVIDPEVSALSTLTNVQNSLFIPNLGGFINRMPTYQISRAPPSDEEQGATSADEAESIQRGPKPDRPRLDQLQPFSSMSSIVEGPRYAVLPDGHELEGWTREDFAELNDHVRHMLHSRRSKFKRSMKGFGQYVRRPLGFLVTLYATLITLFGLAWVLFLIGWINVGGKQLYVINVIDNVLVALFAIMGDGLAPFRAVDTYHMIYIAHYTMLTWKIREKRNLPNLKDKNDLPAQHENDAETEGELSEPKKEEEVEYTVLDARQQERLMHHQAKFAKSHTFYKPHETVTHHAFPLRILIAIVTLLDCHSLLQMALGACTWSMETPGERPFALTTVILCCSITCNISGGILIMIGDRRTRKKDVVERLFRQELTEEAMKKMEKRKVKEEEERKSMQLPNEERKSMQSPRTERNSMQATRYENQNTTIPPDGRSGQTAAQSQGPVHHEPISPIEERPDPFSRV